MKNLPANPSAEATLEVIKDALGLPANATPERVIEYIDRLQGRPTELRKNPKLAAIYEQKLSTGMKPKDALFLAHRELSRQAETTAV